MNLAESTEPERSGGEPLRSIRTHSDSALPSGAAEMKEQSR